MIKRAEISNTKIVVFFEIILPKLPLDEKMSFRKRPFLRGAITALTGVRMIKKIFTIGSATVFDRLLT
jgi:hypothetical protein